MKTILCSIFIILTAAYIFPVYGQENVMSVNKIKNERSLYLKQIDSLEVLYQRCPFDKTNHYYIANEMSDLWDKLAILDVKMELSNFNIENATPEECAILIRKAVASKLDDNFPVAILKKAIDNDDSFTCNLIAVMEAKSRNFEKALTLLHQGGKDFINATNIYPPIYHNLAVVYAWKARNEKGAKQSEYIAKAKKYGKEYIWWYDETTLLKPQPGETYSVNSEFILFNEWLKPDSNGNVTSRNHIKTMLQEINKLQ